MSTADPIVPGTCWVLWTKQHLLALLQRPFLPMALFTADSLLCHLVYMSLQGPQVWNMPPPKPKFSLPFIINICKARMKMQMPIGIKQVKWTTEAGYVIAFSPRSTLFSYQLMRWLFTSTQKFALSHFSGNTQLIQSIWAHRNISLLSENINANRIIKVDWH